MEEILPATLPLGDEDGERQLGRLHLQKPPRTHRYPVSLSLSLEPPLHDVTKSLIASLRPPRSPPGRVVGFEYLQGNSAQHPDIWNSSSTVCSASSDGTVRAWDIQKVSAPRLLRVTVSEVQSVGLFLPLRVSSCGAAPCRVL